MPRKCCNPDCNKRSSYNYKNENKPLYCKDHKLVDMVDVRSKKCNNPDCNKQKKIAIFLNNQIITLSMKQKLYIVKTIN